jgi:signal transduction histidine kinase
MLCLASWLPWQGLAQSPAQDSLRRLLGRLPDQDTAKAWAYLHYGEFFELDKPDSAAFYYQKSRALAERLGFRRGMAAYVGYQIVLLNNQGRYREALALCKEALDIYQQVGTVRDRAVAHTNLANEWEYLGDYGLAAENYLLAKKLAESIQDKPLLRVLNNNLASVFVDQKEYARGKAYAQTALQIAEALGHDYGRASSMINLALAEQHLGNYARARDLFGQVEQIGTETDDYVIQLDGLNGQAEVLMAQLDHAGAGELWQRSLALAQAQGNPPYELTAWKGLALGWAHLRQPERAREALAKALALAGSQGAKLDLRDLYLQAAELEEEVNNWPQALAFRKRYEAFNDSVYNEKSRASIELAEAKYEGERKAAQIGQLEQENRFQRRVNYWAGAAVAALLALGLLLFRYFRQKQLLARQTQALLAQQIRELEQEKQLLAVDAVLRGQEQERGRLAKDLHDGLGGLLSGVKLSLASFINQPTMLQGTQLLPEESAQGLLRAIEMLDASIGELRRVARDLMPEALVRFGLKDALQDFCTNLGQASGLQVSYQTFGLEQRLPATMETVLFRIVQELLNNAVKHARARQVVVQLVRDGQRLSLTVEDDGQGFDPIGLDKAPGIGWANIRSRVEFLGGKLDLQSAPGQGTSVHIELEAGAR